VSAEHVRALVLPLDAPGIVAAAVGSGALVEGPLAHSEADVGLVNALGGGTPLRGAAIPVTSGGRVVNVLYVDRGPGGAHDRYALDEVVVIARAAARRYDALRARP
jgi:hypothetical protein